MINQRKKGNKTKQKIDKREYTWKYNTLNKNSSINNKTIDFSINSKDLKNNINYGKQNHTLSNSNLSSGRKSQAVFIKLNPISKLLKYRFKLKLIYFR